MTIDTPRSSGGCCGGSKHHADSLDETLAQKTSPASDQPSPVQPAAQTEASHTCCRAPEGALPAAADAPKVTSKGKCACRDAHERS